VTTPNSLLTKVHVEGFRSLKDVTVDLGPINVLIGPNGVGKSNLLGVLRLVPLMRTQSLRRYVGEQGGADRVLHYGHTKTSQARIELDFKRAEERFQYAATLGYAAGNTLYFVEESVSQGAAGSDAFTSTESLGSGHEESRLAERAKDPANVIARSVDQLVRRLGFFHFHDTSLMAPLRQNSNPGDNKYLRSDGSNLAALLHRLKNSDAQDTRASWSMIEGTTTRIAPFIKSLDPDLVDPEHPESSALRLYWTDERGHRFDVHDLSDGTLRAIALYSALLQPSATRPAFISIDEPELGLHPAALSLFASLVRSTSVWTQVLLATQSSALLDEFAPDEIIVAEYRKDMKPTKGETSFRRLDLEELKHWLDGPEVAAKLGIEGLKQRCPRFGAWVTSLEALGEQQS
jgi:predicted ATPase